MQKWIVPTYRLQIVGEKNGVICLFIMFTQEDLPVTLKWFAQAVTNFLLPPAENKKRSIFYILITITLELNMKFTLESKNYVDGNLYNY